QFNELVNKVRQLESDKRLAAQRIEHLRDREKNLKEFLEGADTQVKNLEESIGFAEEQINEEQAVLQKLRDELEELRKVVDEKRVAFDDKKVLLDSLRSKYQQKQREQFDAEKKVAIADNSV